MKYCFKAIKREKAKAERAGQKVSILVYLDYQELINIHLHQKGNEVDELIVTIFSCT